MAGKDSLNLFREGATKLGAMLAVSRIQLFGAGAFGLPWFFSLLLGHVVALFFYCLAYRHVFRDRAGIAFVIYPGEMSYDEL
ncbi:MAG: hypothetical protein WBM09_10755 [Gallionella sp.]